MSTVIQRANGDIIYFDTAESVVKDFPNKVTMHPIEDGSPITDHVVSEPRKITVTGVISDAAFMFQDDDPFTTVAGQIGSPDQRRVAIPGRANAALQVLEAIRDGRELFQLETRDEVFENMVFTSFSVPRDSRTGDAARVNFTAQQITTVQRRFATVPQAVSAEDADKASENAETGQQATEDARDKSALLEGGLFYQAQALGTTDAAEISSGLDEMLSVNR